MKKLVSNLMVMLALGGVAVAQSEFDGRDGPVMRYDRAGAQCDLLVRSDVQKDLDLSLDARTTIMQAAERRHAAMDVARTENAGDETATAKEIERVSNDYDRTAWHALTRWQRRRAMEVFIQMADGRALEDPEVQSMLSLSDRQKDKVAQIIRENRIANGSLLAKVNDGQLDDEQMINQRRTNNEHASADLKVVLTDEQRGHLHELAGPPFVPDPTIDDHYWMKMRK